jgi:hypothetical protein
MAPGGTPEHWDFTLLPFASIITRLLDAVAPQSVVEVGADQGDFTEELLEWAGPHGAVVTAVDPEPAPQLIELADAHSELRLVRKASLEALVELPLAQAIILDGDHNYYTLHSELRLIAEKSAESELPLLLLHDLGWPHARRDTYYAPDRIPDADRQPVVHDAMLAPGEAGMAAIGIPFPYAAEREGGPRNGLLTAVEDFRAGRDGIRLAVVPAFFGLGVLWDEDAAWAAEVAELIAPWDSSPLLERLEEVRLASIVDRTRLNRQDELLRAMLNSGSFAVAERLSRLRGRGGAVSRERIRRALGD